MIRMRLVGGIGLLLIAFTEVFAAETLRVASHNIHYMRPNDPEDDWPDRRQAVVKAISEIEPDILAFQEMETFVGGHSNNRNLQLEWVLENHPQYQAGAFSDNADTFPATQPILYKRDRFRLQVQGFFFFSETPEQIYSRQWDGRYPYFVSWVKLVTTATNQAFYVFNFHNDYASRSNRMKSTDLAIQRIRSLAEDSPVILLGDFNAPVWFREIEHFEQIGLLPVSPDGSTNRILGLKLLPAIDHILINGGFQADGPVTVWDDRYDGEYPSDHFPISADLLLKDAP